MLTTVSATLSPIRMVSPMRRKSTSIAPPCKKPLTCAERMPSLASAFPKSKGIKMTRRHVWFTQQEIAAIDRVSKRTGAKFSTLVRLAVDKVYVEKASKGSLGRR